jgi:hypothetical protein
LAQTEKTWKEKIKNHSGYREFAKQLMECEGSEMIGSHDMDTPQK